MTLYSYRCPVHGEFQCAHRADNVNCHINMACSHKAQRVWSFVIASSFQPHYSPSIGAHVNSRAELESELSRASDLASAPQINYLSDGTPVEVSRPPHNFVPVDLHDKQALGVTNDGLDSTYDAWKREGRDDDAKKLKSLMED